MCTGPDKGTGGEGSLISTRRVSRPGAWTLAHSPQLLSPSPLLPWGWVKGLQAASEGGLLHAASMSLLLCPLEPAPLPQRPSPLRGHHRGLRLLLPINCQERGQRSKCSLLTCTVPRGAGRQELRRKGLGEAGGCGDAGKSGKELASAGIPRGGSTMTPGAGWSGSAVWRTTYTTKFTSKYTSYPGDVVERVHPLWASLMDCKERTGQHEMS